jgi:hypothetical protein
MTHPDETPRDEPGQGRIEGAAEPSSDLPFDEEAAWRAIVENYGDRPEMGDDRDATTPAPVEEPPAAPISAVFDRSFIDAQEVRAAETPDRDGWADEGHFVPPDPPPVPRGTPARRLAWLGLFGAPVAMLAAVVFHLLFPPWLVLLLVAAFIGGFVFLVATMPRDRGDWSGDDGAVV